MTSLVGSQNYDLDDELSDIDTYSLVYPPILDIANAKDPYCGMFELKDGHCNIKDSYGIVRNGEVFLLNMFIGQYKEGNLFNHDETRSRKLLLHKKEIKKIAQAIETQGLTLVPLKVYFKENHLKVLLGICRGKKTFDKRETIKERDIQKEVKKNIKNRY